MKKRTEWSKVVCGIIIAYGMLMGIAYYVAVFAGKSVDSGLATQCVVTIIGAFFSYTLYNLGLKHSRNKYGIDSDGSPYCVRTEDSNVDDVD